VRQQRVKPKADPNHPGEPGKGKIGRVNASKLPMRLRNFGSPVRWLGRRLAGQKWTRPPNWFERGHHGPGVQQHPPRSCLTGAERGNPVWSGLKSVSQAIFGSEAHFPSGTRRFKKRMSPAERQGNP